jgi:hypothetical protein
MNTDKPIRESYINNKNHKENQIKKVKLYLANSHSDTRTYLHDGNWNHKKTNAQKAVWSCTGYGGKCSSCKRSSWDTVKNRKTTYEFNGIEKHF